MLLVVKRIRNFLPLLFIVAVSISAWFFGLYKYVNFQSLQQNHLLLSQFIAHNQVLSAVLYCAFYMLLVGFCIPIAALLTLTGGFLFGQWIGTFLAIFSASIGATFVFMSAKMAATPVIQKKSGQWIQRMQEGFQKNSFSYVITLRLMPIVPFVLVHIVAGFFQIPIKSFFLGTFIGIIPLSFIYAGIGVSLQKTISQSDINFWSLFNTDMLLILTVLIILSIIPPIYRYCQRR
ncbi:MAG TPA: VTT domain-containing protein [Alphaproteobacteria bacterium]|nr:VTT domain-containing protein [Alphaproteobacteria bacterium]